MPGCPRIVPDGEPPRVPTLFGPAIRGGLSGSFRPVDGRAWGLFRQVCPEVWDRRFFGGFAG